MIYYKTFLNSLKLPNKKAMFQLNRTGMDTAIIYIFILILIASVPEFVTRITSPDQVIAHDLIFTAYFLIFYYVPLAIMTLFALSFVAYVYTLFAKIVERKLRFQIIWKLTAYTTTIPILLITSIAFFVPIPVFLLLPALIWITLLVTLMITSFPKYKKRKVQS